MDLARLQQQPRFLVGQRISMMVNRYTVTAAAPDGGPGETVAFVEQSRFKLREQVTFYTYDTKREELFAFNARQVIDVGATYDVITPGGEILGSFRNDAFRSLLSSTWHVQPAGGAPIVGSERSTLVAILRRVQETLPLPYHFDFRRDGQPVLSVDRKWGVRDRYVVDIADPHIDRRLVIAVAVALDALQSR